MCVGLPAYHPAAVTAFPLQDEFPLISVPLDTWVGRYVRITTPRHKGTTGLVHRTGNGWVNLQTSLGDVAKRAYDLVVIPQSKANISGVPSGMAKGDLSRGKRYSRGSKGECGAVRVFQGTISTRKKTSTKNMKFSWHMCEWHCPLPRAARPFGDTAVVSLFGRNS